MFVSFIWWHSANSLELESFMTSERCLYEFAHIDFSKDCSSDKVNLFVPS